MGCDFYTYYVLCIQYKKGQEVKVEKMEIEDTRERHYFYGSCERDEDFEELNDYWERYERFKREQVENELVNYPKKEIYKNNKWLCLQASQEKYINLCKKFGISENNLISIWKEGDFHFR